MSVVLFFCSISRSDHAPLSETLRLASTSSLHHPEADSPQAPHTICLHILTEPHRHNLTGGEAPRPLPARP